MEGRRHPGPLESLGGARKYEGAEAVLYEAEWFGRKVLIKVRVPKEYRHPELDAKLLSQRTVAEAKNILAALEAGVDAPAVLFVSPEEGVIVIEHIEGELLRDLIEREGASDRVLKLVERVGFMAGLLHDAGIVHGDLTTSNVIVASSDKPYIIDFGLSSRSGDELDHAVDVHLFLRSLESTHPEYVSELYEAFLRGYGAARGQEKAKRVAMLVERIRAMGRYVEARRRAVWRVGEEQ